MVVVEFFFRPKNFLHRWLANLIGAPTCGVLRGGPELDDSGRLLRYEVGCAFNARDHVNAELEVFPARRAVPSDVKDATKVLAASGLKAWFKRMNVNGDVRKIWRSGMHADIPNFTVGQKLHHTHPDFARGAQAIDSGLQDLTVVAVVEHGPKDRYITVHQRDLTK